MFGNKIHCISDENIGESSVSEREAIPFDIGKYSGVSEPLAPACRSQIVGERSVMGL